MADLNDLAPLIIPDNNIEMIWNDQDQEILEWLFPALRDETPPAPRTPDRSERKLRRQNALSPKQWKELIETF